MHVLPRFTFTLRFLKESPPFILEMQLSAALLMAAAAATAAALAAAVPAPNTTYYHAGPGGFAGVRRRVGRQAEQPARSVIFLADVVPVIADKMELDHAAYGDETHHCTSTGLCTVTPVAKEDGGPFNAVGSIPIFQIQ